MLLSTLRCATAAVEALGLCPPSLVEWPSLMRMLSPLLSTLCREPVLGDPFRSRSAGPAVASAAALAQAQLLRTLRGPTAIPAAGQEALSALCLRSLRALVACSAGAPFFPPGEPAYAAAAQLLEPWIRPGTSIGDDADDADDGCFTAEESLVAGESVDCAPGAPCHAVRTLGLRTGIGYGAVHEGGPLASMNQRSSRGNNTGSSSAFPSPSPSVFSAGVIPGDVVCSPQGSALTLALSRSQIFTLGTLLRQVEAPNQEVLLDALLALAGEPGAKRRPELCRSRRVAAALSAAVALAAFDGDARDQMSASHSSAARQFSGLGPRLARLAEITLTAGLSPSESPSLPLLRAAARLRALAAVAEGTPLLTLRALCTDAAETSSLLRRTAVTLAAASIARAAGGLGLQSGYGLAVATLRALCTASTAPALEAAAYALRCLARAAGSAFLEEANPVLDTCRSLLLRADLYSDPDFLPALGRLVNAAVAALGPEYRLGSKAYEASKLVVSEAVVASKQGMMTSTSSSAAIVASMTTSSSTSSVLPLVAVLHTQMLVLFCPGALPAGAHLAVLAGALTARPALLRGAALRTLRHLAERDARALLATPRDVPRALVAAMDAETLPDLVDQAEAALRALLRAGGALAPGAWVALAGGVVLDGAAAGGKAAKLADPGMMSRSTEGTTVAAPEEEEDDDNLYDDEGALAGPGLSGAAASPSTEQQQRAVNPAASIKPQQQVPRLRTQMFLAACLASLPRLAAKRDVRHVDASKATASSGGDWLVLRLQQLVQVGYIAATGPSEVQHDSIFD